MRRTLWVVVGCFFATLAVVGVGPRGAFADLPELQSCVVAPELSVMMTGADVRCLQFTLALLEYPVVYNGIFDRATEDAVFWFQANTPGLQADGRAGVATLQALNIHAGSVRAGFQPTLPFLPKAPLCLADAQVDPNERGQSVTCVQRRLTTLGYYTGSITGLHDRASVDAVRAYQKATPPLRVDGKAGAATLASMGIWSGIATGNGGTTGPGPFPAPMTDEPFWSLTSAGIPFYAWRTPCNPSEAAVIAAEFANDGADAATQQWAVYIASREGGCRFDAVNINARTRDDSHCTFQLNALSGAFTPAGSLGRRGWTVESVKTSLQACADAASDLWVYCGRGPWLPPYFCTPPWAGAANGQPAPMLPVMPEPEPPSEPAPADSPLPLEPSPGVVTTTAHTDPVPGSTTAGVTTTTVTTTPTIGTTTTTTTTTTTVAGS